MTVALTPPALRRDRFCTIEKADEVSGLAKFSGIDDLDAAEGVAGCYVLAREDDLDLGLLDRAFDDLVGRPVVDERYGELGTLSEVMETPANDVWVVQGGRYGEVLIPAIEDVIVDLPDTGSISVRIMDGLIDADAPMAKDDPCA